MGKNTRGNKEFSREQELVHQNQELRREIARLRKRLARLDLDRHDYVKQIIEKSYQMEEELEGKKILEKLRKQWSCRQCARGYLEIITYNRPDATFYYRHCTNCSYRTRSKRYTPQVQGIVKDEENS